MHIHDKFCHVCPATLNTSITGEMMAMKFDTGEFSYNVTYSNFSQDQTPIRALHMKA
jgi:hypothetical protein